MTIPEVYDLIIIGGGPAGLTAGIYALRARLNTILLEKFIPGGIAVTTDIVENYPGFISISGTDLMQKFEEHAREVGLKVISETVEKIEIKDKVKIIYTSNNRYETLSIVIATGTYHKRLNISGESKLIGKGVSYCAVCDGPLFKNKNIAVIGCGNSGIQEGLFLLKFVNHITFVEFLPYITADKILQERIQSSPKATFYLNHTLNSINGENGVASITITDKATGKQDTINIDGVFIYIGLVPNTKFLDNVVKLDKSGYVITNDNLETSVTGVFAAGDVRSKYLRQIVTSAGDGALAAFMAGEYIDSIK